MTVKGIRHGMSVREFLQEHRPNNPDIAVVGFHSGEVFYDGKRDDANGDCMDMAVVMAHPDQKKYVYIKGYDGDDKDSEVYKIVVQDQEEDLIQHVEYTPEAMGYEK
mgnify:CR=1 FL=1